MIDLKLTPSLPEVEKMLGPEFAKQAKFALAKSLSKTAVDAKKRLQGALSADFTVRSRWTAGSFRTTPATKTTLVAEVGSTADYMALQATGGPKTSKSGKDVGVPVGARPTPTARTTPAKFPSRMLKKKKVFVQTTKGGLVGVWQRKGKARYPLMLLWILKKQVDIQPRWDFKGQVERAVQLDWHRHIEAALDAALRDPGKPR